ncbi:MAG: T9SS type A sorting domain-containing protein [Bacteroidales bacterium]|nr:T9SS type A sorting domain-containing protein [Bacteroidales bacterium]
MLTLAEAAEGAELMLCDLGGRELRREQVTGTTHSLDVSALPTGVYLLKLTTPQGVATLRLLVE